MRNSGPHHEGAPDRPGLYPFLWVGATPTVHGLSLSWNLYDLPRVAHKGQIHMVLLALDAELGPSCLIQEHMGQIS